METFVVIAGIILIAIIALLAYVATRPDMFRVERKLGIKAAPEAIFPFFNDFRRWSAWSPYERKDPDMKRLYSGADSGVGSIYEWDGNRNVGKGRIEITETEAPFKVAIKLDFIAPFEGHNIGEFLMVPKGDVTEVTWAMYGPSNFMSKLMGLVFNMDRMIGADFEAGLANLKRQTEH